MQLEGARTTRCTQHVAGSGVMGEAQTSSRLLFFRSSRPIFPFLLFFWELSDLPSFREAYGSYWKLPDLQLNDTDRAWSIATRMDTRLYMGSIDPLSPRLAIMGFKLQQRYQDLPDKAVP